MTIGARHLRTFLAIAETRSITDGAAMLGLSQPTASRVLQQLEKHLDRRLVDRSTHHLHLTEQGIAFQIRAAAAVRALDVALDPASFATRPLRVGHAWSAFGHRTASLMAQWRNLHPRDPIELHRVDERLGGLGSGNVDVAVLRDLDPDLPLRRRWIGREERFVALATAHPLARRTSVTLAELRDYAIVVNTTSGTTSRSLWDDDKTGRPQSSTAVTNTDDWMYAIAAGDKIGITSEATAHLFGLRDLVYLPIDDAPAITVELVWTEPSSHPLVEDFADYCSQVFS